MLRWILLAAALSLVAAPAANADSEFQRVSLGDGLKLSWSHDSGLRVRKGKRATRISLYAYDVRFKVSKARRQVTIDYDDACSMEQSVTYSFDELLARIENASAFRLHRKKKYKQAAAGFAKAATLAPAWRIPATNLASALNLLGDKTKAVAALAPWIASGPYSLYAKVLGDSELASLIDEEQVAAIRAKKPGKAAIGRSGLLPKGAAYSPELGLLAAIHSEASWGSCAFESSLVVFEAATGKELARLSVVDWDDTDPDDCERGLTRAGKRRLRKRLVMVNRYLKDLGFSTPKGIEQGKRVADDGDGDSGYKTRMRFSKAKLGLVWQDGTGRVLRKNDVLGVGQGLDNLHGALYVPAANAMVLDTGRAGAEGCEGTDPTEVVVIPLNKPE